MSGVDPDYDPGIDILDINLSSDTKAIVRALFVVAREIRDLRTAVESAAETVVAGIGPDQYEGK